MSSLKVKKFQPAGGKPVGYFILGITENKSSWYIEYFLKLSADKLLVFKWSQAVVRAGIGLGASGLQFQRPNHSATLPPSDLSGRIALSNV